MARGQKRKPRPSVPFNRKLVLNQWVLALFGVERFDQHIVSVTQRLNERRITRGNEPVVWKYFQYLALLFTEIYLDRYFRAPRSLIAALNGQVALLNEGLPEADRIEPFDPDAEAWPQLNKIAFWMATGSGKTLLMHAHILQYRRLLECHGRARELNRIILLTPNEGNNLVLVDEGHRGASSSSDGAWMKYRNALCEKGFSFEYSATFGQAVRGNRALTDLYARSILFDYS